MLTKRFAAAIKDVTMGGVHMRSALNVVSTAYDPDARKAPKDEVLYTSDGTEAEHCSICQHYDTPRRCAVVRGAISPAGWCDRFSKDITKANGIPDEQMRRRLERHDAKTSKTPFQHHGSILSQLRPDQVPRVLAALTNPRDLPMREVELGSLIAGQNRVDPEKVEFFRLQPDRAREPATVVHLGNGRNLIADGHHRLARDWLDGKERSLVRYKDVGRMSNALKRDVAARICKVDDGHGLVLGYAIVCKLDGEAYYDLQGDHISEDAMLGAAVDFMLDSRMAKEMHVGDAKGSIVFAWPMTTEIAESFGVSTPDTGLMVAMRPDDPAMLAKFKDGTYTGFSIGGKRLDDEDVED